MSTGPGTSPTLGQAGTPATVSADGLTGYTGPVNPPEMRLATNWCPTLPARREAPTTATERGRSRRPMERTAASRSRSATAWAASADGAMSRTTPMTSDARVYWRAKPASRKTPSMRWLSDSVSAANRRIPWRRAMVARCSSSKVPSPRPWNASSTTKATSASSLTGGTVVAGDGDDAPGELGDERHAVDAVAVGEALHLGVGQLAGAVRRSAG